MRSLVVHKTSSQADQPEEATTRYDLSSRLPTKAQELATAIQGH